MFAPVAGHAELIGRVLRDTSPFRVIQSPGHPAADGWGNLKLPNVDPAKEAAEMRATMGTYESNMQMIATLDELDRRTIGLPKV